MPLIEMLILIKTKAVFLFGFIIGGVLALLLMLAEDLITDEAACSAKAIKLPSDTKNENYEGYITLEKQEKNDLSKVIQKSTYQKWLQLQNVKLSRVNMDELVYGKKLSAVTTKSLLLEADWLKSRIHITCAIFVNKIKLARSIRDTWAPHCNNIYYFAADRQDQDIPVINFDIKLTSSWQLLCESIRHIWKKSLNNSKLTGTDTNNRIEWVIFVKDDTMVIPENLRYLVASMDFENSYYLGHPVTLWGQAYNVAQAGYVLSKRALAKIATNFNTRDKCATGGKYWKQEDYYLGKHLGSMGITPSDTRDKNLSGTFHGYSLQILLWGVAKSGRYWTHALYPIGPSCCSSKSITFSAGEADKMYNLYYLIYRLNIYLVDRTFGHYSAPTEIPDPEMWKVILKEEFNITNLSDISSQRYYDIWRDRYSEPEKFIRNTYKNMPDVLSSLLTAYEAERKLEKANSSLS
ncbi:glycoprotein-N-acetylgalactosamine 3-beta-galactosyltransferase 1-like [Athalia rosae]|uniref:glycoprotein-N-acetylgalactosamine 3-beta-galactosyltransferase 1-like n=1 Tax=Athalia rosae TaxID=37344 RepID=UPI0020344E8F|nr:glycoprotein-N-acetylgalactosamine 3-beta-galactosyltransferase 1-like [Athalia rosae]